MNRRKKNVFNVYDNATVKWENDSKLYCLHIQNDETAGSPREEWDHITIMACWHRRYKLGDKLKDKEPEDFWQRLVKEHVSESEFYAIAEAGKLPGIRIAQNEDSPELVNIYETSAVSTVLGQSEPEESLEYEGVHKDAVIDYLLDDLTVKHCMTLMEPYAEWMPLWLYDHSGLTISCGVRSYPYNDPWDSGCLGWIVALKKTVMSETTELIRDEEGQLIREEHKHDNAPSTWGYKSRPLTDETWRKRAIEIMEADVEVYDQFLTGDVYGFTLYEADPVEAGEEPAWNESDSCWGFYGANVLENGICEQVGCGLREAILAGQYESGKAELHTTHYYTF